MTACLKLRKDHIYTVAQKPTLIVWDRLWTLVTHKKKTSCSIPLWPPQPLRFRYAFCAQSMQLLICSDCCARDPNCNLDKVTADKFTATTQESLLGSKKNHPYFFCLLNVAASFGLWCVLEIDGGKSDFLRGEHIQFWVRHQQGVGSSSKLVWYYGRGVQWQVNKCVKICKKQAENRFFCLPTSRTQYFLHWHWMLTMISSQVSSWYMRSNYEWISSVH